MLVTTEAASGIRINTRAGIQAETVDRAALDRALPGGAVHQGVAALAEPLDEPDLDTVLDGLKDGAPATILLLDQVTDPQRKELSDGVNALAEPLSRLTSAVLGA